MATSKIAMNTSIGIATGIEGCTAMRSGNLVVLTFFGTPVMASATLPSGLIPLHRVRFLLEHGTSNSLINCQIVENTGVVSFTTSQTSGYMYGEAVYFVA